MKNNLTIDYFRIQEEEEKDETGEEDEGSDGDLVLPPITVRSPSIVPPLPMPPTDFSPPSPMPSPGVLPMMQPEMFDDWIDRKLAEQRDGKVLNKADIFMKYKMFPDKSFIYIKGRFSVR